MVKKLNDLGIPLKMDAVIACTEGDQTSIGRPHIARALWNEGFVASMQEAFNKYIADYEPAHGPKIEFAVNDAIDTIHKAGGLAVLAHPGSLKRDELIPGFVDMGLNGLEVIHPDHDAAGRRYYSQLAKKYSLVTTGGSDFHGPKQKRCELGDLKVHYQHLIQLKSLLV